MSRALTPKTNLETLRKDAKRWLKALRANDPAAWSRLQAAWPEAPAEPGLRDVQQALARAYGCENWIALKAAIDDLALERQSRAERLDRLLRHGWDRDQIGVARRILARDPEIARENLFAAATCGDLHAVKRLLARDPGAARTTGGSRAWTALAYVTYGRLDAVNAVEIARRLLDAGADPNFGFDDGWGSPFKVLTGAIGLGEGAKPSHPQALDLVELLVASGADPYDRQALYNVSIVGTDVDWYEVLWRLCEAQGRIGAWRDPKNSFFDMPMLDYLLGAAVGQDHLERAEWLLDRGADPNAAHAYTRQSLHVLARLSGFAAMAALLEARGARPARLSGGEALQAACLANDEAAARALVATEPILISNPAPLLHAAMFGKADAVRLLLDLGADARATDREGISPLHRAVQSGSLEAVDLLLAAGADPDLRERKWGGTPMSWSIVLGRPHVAARLAPLSRDVRGLASGAFLERLDALLREEPALANHRHGEDAPTPLFCLPDDEAAAVDVARLLLARGADPRAKNAKGATAIEAARLRGLDEAADLMEGGEAD